MRRLLDSPLALATWADWLDIALLSWLIYRVMLVIRGTRAQRSLIGLAILFGVYLLSSALRLSALSWVLDNIAVYLVIAVLVLFQDDIRNALATAGGALFSPDLRRSETAILEDVTRAVFQLAGRRVGAIIVLERLASLVPFTEGAHAIDARVSAELLAAIFHPSSPLHDGAVVIRGDRVAAAGVFLPLTLSKDVGRAFGTRHRAAIGLSESTDALCLVVSEERGTVSLVDGGVVTPVADVNELRERLFAGLDRRPAGEPARAAT